MPATIVSSDFIGLGTITSRSEDASFPDGNVGDQWHLKRRFRAGDANVNDWLLRFDLGAAKTIEAVVLDDVNFDAVKLDFGDASGGADDTSGDLVVNIDTVVNRYKIIYIPTAVITRRHVEIHIPAGTSAVGSYTAKWEVGRVGVLDSVTEITKNTYSRTSIKAFRDIDLPSGGRERVGLGEIGWEGSIGFDTRKESDEASLWALNNMDVAEPLMLYENDSVTNKVYFCLRDDAYAGELIYHGVARGNSVKFKELL